MAAFLRPPFPTDPCPRMRKSARALAAACLSWGFALAWAAPAPPSTGDGLGELNVLHWWTSAGERAAANHVAARMAENGLKWMDAAVAGGGGGPAVKVLNERILRRMAPKVAQLNGQSMAEWADMGLLLELDQVAAKRSWSKVMFPTVMAQLMVHGHVVAAPLGVHRINNLYVNKALLRRHGLTPGEDWDSLMRAAASLRAAGVVPVAFSDEPWQVATVFEALLLSEAGPLLYKRMLVQRDPRAFDDPALERALSRLRSWRNLAQPLPGAGTPASSPAATLGERSWSDVVSDFAGGRAAMLIMGDWARGELGALGLEGGRDFECRAVPGTAQAHLFSIDTLVMLAGAAAAQADQEKMAELLGSATLQLGYNRIKGSIPVRRDVPVDELDPCAQQSFALFANPATQRVPSLVHRMAFGEVGKNAIIETVHQFALNPNQTPADAKRRLQGLMRALSPRPSLTPSSPAPSPSSNP